MMRYTDFTVLPNGNLKVSLTDDGRKEQAWQATHPANEYEHDMDFDEWIEWHLGNGWELLNPEDIGALTSCPWILADAAAYDDDGAVTFAGKVYWYPQYEVLNPRDVLERDGYVILEGVKADD